jgi:hypothetical protein
MMMFENIIESILINGAEMWGWKEQEEVEKVQKKYLRGQKETRGCIEKCKKNRPRVKA